MNGLVWLRSDLRIDDNPALNIANNECSKIACIYLLSEKEWKSHNNANVKLDFVIRNLSDLKNDLQKHNIPLVTASIKSFDEVSIEIERFCEKNNISKKRPNIHGSNWSIYVHTFPCIYGSWLGNHYII